MSMNEIIGLLKISQIGGFDGLGRHLKIMVSVEETIENNWSVAKNELDIRHSHEELCINLWEVKAPAET